MTRRLAIAVVVGVSILIAASASADTFKLTFWANEGTEELPNVVWLNEDHPCGTSVTLEVSEMPPEHPAFDAEIVVEFDAHGEIIRRWRVPIDLTPFGVVGQQVIMGRWNYEAQALAVGVDGSLALVPEPEWTAQMVSCSQDVVELFAPSDYLGCKELQDLVTGEVRLLGFQGPCT